ncbi:MAG: head-tail connector protein [Parvularculaceae bacterium]
MSLVQLSPPAGEPIPLAELKAHLRVTQTAEDALVAGLGLAARQAIEARFGLAILPQAWRLRLDVASCAVVELPLSPVASVDAVTGYRPDGGGEALSADAFAASAGHVGRVRIDVAGALRAPFDAIAIDFTAGWPDAASAPQEILLAIKALAAHFYENREAAGTDRFHTSPESLNALMAPWRRVRL